MKLNQTPTSIQLKVRQVLNQAGIRNKKVFVIGFNKSASSSFHALFESLGLPSYHGVAWRDLQDQKLLQKYDCFSDGIPSDLALLDQMYPGSKFILNTRSLKGWIYSRLAHIERTINGDKTNPNWHSTESAIKGWIRKRNEYHLSVLSYFAKRPQDLLVVNYISDKQAASKVCKFLGFNDHIEKPRKNVNPKKETSQKHIEMLNHCIEALGIPEHELSYDIYCPSLEHSTTNLQQPYDSSLLTKNAKLQEV